MNNFYVSRQLINISSYTLIKSKWNIWIKSRQYYLSCLNSIIIFTFFIVLSDNILPIKMKSYACIPNLLTKRIWTAYNRPTETTNKFCQREKVRKYYGQRQNAAVSSLPFCFIPQNIREPWIWVKYLCIITVRHLSRIKTPKYGNNCFGGILLRWVYTILDYNIAASHDLKT